VSTISLYYASRLIIIHSKLGIHDLLMNLEFKQLGHQFSPLCIGTYRREGVKNYPLFLAHQKGDIFFWREVSKSFCHMSHVHFCVSVSTQFLAFLEALHYEKFIYHVIK